MGTGLTVACLGTVPYDEAYGLQRRIAAVVRKGGGATLILLEHPPTYTIGVRGDERNVLASTERLTQLGAELVRTDRGGDVTFHGPGQVVGYGIVDLRDLGVGVSDYVCGLEQLLIGVLAGFNIAAERSSCGRGVWVDGAKIAAIGVRVSRGVTTHGFALNVNTDLKWFDHIVPCGLADVRVTSMREALGRACATDDVMAVVANSFASRFGMTLDSRKDAFA